MKTLLLASLYAFSIIYCSPLSAQVPVLNSYPVAKATVYLDFDGQYVQGTIWNQNGPIAAQSSGLSAADITEIFTRISANYRAFNLNITTDSNVFNNAPILQRIRVIFTSSNFWHEAVGGLSCVGSFTSGDATPAWVFNTVLENNPKYTAAAASHEIGHALGLQHQSIYDSNNRKITEYNGGKGDWAPIMGVGYYKQNTTWYTGASTLDAETVQDDIAVITGSPDNFGFRKATISAMIQSPIRQIWTPLYSQEVRPGEALLNIVACAFPAFIKQ